MMCGWLTRIAVVVLLVGPAQAMLVSPVLASLSDTLWLALSTFDLAASSHVPSFQPGGFS